MQWERTRLESSHISAAMISTPRWETPKTVSRRARKLPYDSLKQNVVICLLCFFVCRIADPHWFDPDTNPHPDADPDPGFISANQDADPDLKPHVCIFKCSGSISFWYFFWRKQCCGSGMFNQDQTFCHPGFRIRMFASRILDPHQRIKVF